MIFSNRGRGPLASALAAGGLALAAFTLAPGVAHATMIELTPGDVGSTSSSVFSTLPSADPALFGFTGVNTFTANFDVDDEGVAIPTGVALTDQYADWGLTITGGVTTSTSVYGGEASSPNAAYVTGGAQIYSFAQGISRVGIINTSPDRDQVRVYDVEGDLIAAFTDQAGVSTNYNIDRFVGWDAGTGPLIGSIVFSNASGNLELDELVFTVADISGVPLPGAGLLLAAALGGLGLAARARNRV